MGARYDSSPVCLPPGTRGTCSLHQGLSGRPSLPSPTIDFPLLTGVSAPIISPPATRSEGGKALPPPSLPSSHTHPAPGQQLGGSRKKLWAQFSVEGGEATATSTTPLVAVSPQRGADKPHCHTACLSHGLGNTHYCCVQSTLAQTCCLGSGVNMYKEQEVGKSGLFFHSGDFWQCKRQWPLCLQGQRGCGERIPGLVLNRKD